MWRRAIVENKQSIVIAIAAMVTFAYAFPYGVGVEAKKDPLGDKFAENLKNKINNIMAYGHVYGLGLFYDYFKNIDPLRCR